MSISLKGCLLSLAILVVVGVAVLAVIGAVVTAVEDQAVERSSETDITTPTEVSIPPPASSLAVAEARSAQRVSSAPQILTVASGGPTVRVAVGQKVSHSELRRIAQQMRERWKDGQGEFAVARGDREWRALQLRVATTFVFFYLPGMNFERDNAWARVEIPPGGSAEVTIISP